MDSNPEEGVLFDYSQDTIQFSKARCRILKVNFMHCIKWFPDFPIQIGNVSIEGESVVITGDRPEFSNTENRQEDGNLLLRCIEDLGDGLDSDN